MPSWSSWGLLAPVTPACFQVGEPETGARLRDAARSLPHHALHGIGGRMGHARWSSGRNAADRERLGELFERALALPAAERAGFVERECADGALRSELTSLLA